MRVGCIRPGDYAVVTPFREGSWVRVGSEDFGGCRILGSVRLSAGINGHDIFTAYQPYYTRYLSPCFGTPFTVASVFHSLRLTNDRCNVFCFSSGINLRRLSRMGSTVQQSAESLQSWLPCARVKRNKVCQAEAGMKVRKEPFSENFRA